LEINEWIYFIFNIIFLLFTTTAIIIIMKETIINY